VAFGGQPPSTQIYHDMKLSNFDFNDLLRRAGKRAARPFWARLTSRSAILAITHAALTQKAYFLTRPRRAGSGRSRRAASRAGCDGLCEIRPPILTNENVLRLESSGLERDDSIPADCSLLIIPSGRQPLSRLSSNELFKFRPI